MLFEIAARTVSENTRKAYGRDVAAFGEWLEATHGIPSPQALAWLISFETPGEPRMVVLEFQGFMMKEGLSKATVARRIRALNSIVKKLNFAERVPWKLEVPVDKIEALKDVRGPGVERVRDLMDAARRDPRWFGLRDLAMIQLMAFDNLRAGEVGKLRWTDLRHGEHDHDLEVYVRGKGGKDLWHPVHPDTHKTLEAWTEVREVRLEEVGKLSGDVPWVFFSSRTGPLSGPRVWERVMKRAQEAGMNRLHPHALRHHAITQKAKAWKGSTAALVRWARHSDANMTQRYIDDVKNEVYQIAQLGGDAADD